MFLLILSNLLNKHAPLTKMVIHDDLPAWMTREYLETANDRDYWLGKKRTSDDPIINITWKQYKWRTRMMKRNLKRDFFRVALEDAKGDSGCVWKVVEKAYNSVT